MLDKLIDVLIAVWSWFVPFAVVDDYEQAIVLRFGKYHRTLAPGFHWVWPCGSENVLQQCVAWDTSALHDQSLVTLDEHQVSVSAVITWRVHDVRRFLIDVQDQAAVLSDVTYGLVALHVRAHAWKDLTDAEGLEALTKEVRKRAFRYGIEVAQVQFANVTKSRAIRLLGMSS